MTKIITHAFIVLVNSAIYRTILKQLLKIYYSIDGVSVIINKTATLSEIREVLPCCERKYYFLEGGTSLFLARH